MGEIGYKSVGWVNWVRTGDKGRGLLNAVNYLQISYEARKLLKTLSNYQLLDRTLYHETVRRHTATISANSLLNREEIRLVSNYISTRVGRLLHSVLPSVRPSENKKELKK